jgi:hypothetical protein
MKRLWKLVGRGSVDPYTECCLIWSGNFGLGGTYYVAVERAGGQAAASYYLLEIDGEGVLN